MHARANFASSLPDLIRQSIFFKKMDTRVKPAYDELSAPISYFTTAAVCPNKSLRSSSVRIAGWPKFGLTSLAIA